MPLSNQPTDNSIKYLDSYRFNIYIKTNRNIFLECNISKMTLESISSIKMRLRNTIIGKNKNNNSRLLCPDKSRNNITKKYNNITKKYNNALKNI
jgi:hypothetical protein